jgi:DNA-binding GntR family transcriptional regulator
MSYPDLSTLLPADGSSRRITAHEFVVGTLRRAILGGQLAGGTRLVQSDVARDLKVSTTPVREALRDLAAEGLVQMDAHRGAIVQQLDATDLEEIYGIRTVLEPYCARLGVARISEEQLAEVTALQAQMDAERDIGSWVELNRRFHRVLIEASRSTRLIGLLKNLQDAASIYVSASLQTTPEDQRTGNLEHHAILDAYRKRDPDAATRAILTHLNRTMAIVEDKAAHESAADESPVPSPA